MAKRGLSGIKFRQRVGRETEYHMIFTIFVRTAGIKYVQFTISHTRGDFTKIRNQAMDDLKKKINLPRNSPEFIEEAMDRLLRDIFKSLQIHGDKTRLTEALKKRLIPVALEVRKKEGERNAKMGEVLLVTIAFHENGVVGIKNTPTVTLKPKHPMRIIGDTVKAVVDFTTMVYAETCGIKGLEQDSVKTTI
jgi:hypothetical protein